MGSISVALVERRTTWTLRLSTSRFCRRILIHGTGDTYAALRKIQYTTNTIDGTTVS